MRSSGCCRNSARTIDDDNPFLQGARSLPVADTVELVASWIVAGLVTTAGVLLAHRQAERSRQHQEDRVTIYEPLHREMEAALSRGSRLLRDGNRVWSPSTDFSDLMNRGALIPKRHDPLRADISELLRLQERHEVTFLALYHKREKAIQDKWEETELEDEEGDRRKLADLLGHNFSNDQFNQALTSLDKESWTRELNVRVTGQGGNLGFKLRLLTSAEDLFDEITAGLAPEQKAFMQDGEALLQHVERIKSALERALKDGSAYRARTSRGRS